MNIVGGFHLRYHTTLMGNRRRANGDLLTLEETVAGLIYGRFGIVVFAKELQIPAMAWTAGEHLGDLHQYL